MRGTCENVCIRKLNSSIIEIYDNGFFTHVHFSVSVSSYKSFVVSFIRTSSRIEGLEVYTNELAVRVIAIVRFPIHEMLLSLCKLCQNGADSNS